MTKKKWTSVLSWRPSLHS